MHEIHFFGIWESRVCKWKEMFADTHGMYLHSSMKNNDSFFFFGMEKLQEVPLLSLLCSFSSLLQLQCPVSLCLLRYCWYVFWRSICFQEWKVINTLHTQIPVSVSSVEHHHFPWSSWCLWLRERNVCGDDDHHRHCSRDGDSCSVMLSLSCSFNWNIMAEAFYSKRRRQEKFQCRWNVMCELREWLTAWWLWWWWLLKPSFHLCLLKKRLWFASSYGLLSPMFSWCSWSLLQISTKAWKSNHSNFSRRDVTQNPFVMNSWLMCCYTTVEMRHF